jgi:hypothetical protein
LEKSGIDPKEILECLRGYCAKASPKGGPPRIAIVTQLRQVFQDDRIVRAILSQVNDLDE